MVDKDKAHCRIAGHSIFIDFLDKSQLRKPMGRIFEHRNCPDYADCVITLDMMSLDQWKNTCTRCYNILS